MTDPRARLLQLSKDHHCSLTRLSEMIGRNPTYLQQFIRKGSPRRLEEGDRRVLAEFFGVSEGELGAPMEKSYGQSGQGAGGMVKEPYDASAALPVEGDWVDVGRLALSASAGPGMVVNDETPFDHFRFSRRWLRESGLEAAHLSAITIEGDSMEPLLRSGDEVLVDRTSRPFRDGIHVVRLGDTLLVKRVASHGGGRFSLLSQNLAYPPMEVSAAELEIIGRVVWKGGRV